jgi:vacuolar protein sorting-associated protein 72
LAASSAKSEVSFPLSFHSFLTILESKNSHELCAITGYPAKYRDPSTGLPYCNTYAYKEIQRLKRGEYKWSKLVGAYVGQGTYAARGVPPRFLNKPVPPVPAASPQVGK